MKLRISLSLLLLMSFFTGFSQSRIKVHFPGSENKTAHIWAYTDYISLNKTELKSVGINKKGDFDFELYIDFPKPIFIQVSYFRIQLFLEPKRDYEITIDPVDFNDMEFYPKNVIAYLSPNFVIVKPKEKELNNGIKSVEELFSSFVDSNYLSLVRGQNTKLLVDSFVLKMEHFTNTYGNDYLSDYAAIQMAQLRLLSHEYSQKMVVEKYFEGKNLNLNDPKAMFFFNSFWSNYLLNKGKGYSIYQLDSVINIHRSYQALSALLAHDPLLEDSTLRELVIIRNIQQLYGNRSFNKEALVHILYDISRSKLRKEHQAIAVNVRKRLTTYEQGSKAPVFEFTDITGIKFKLSDFEGMYVYLNIWNTECADCIAEMEYTKELFEEFDDVIKFISISVDASPELMKAYAKSRGFQWTVAHLGENYGFLNDYRISVLPRYILIDKEGNMEMVDAPKPSSHFSDYFLNMLNDKKGNLRIRE